MISSAPEGWPEAFGSRTSFARLTLHFDPTAQCAGYFAHPLQGCAQWTRVVAWSRVIAERTRCSAMAGIVERHGKDCWRLTQRSLLMSTGVTKVGSTGDICCSGVGLRTGFPHPLRRHCPLSSTTGPLPKLQTRVQLLTLSLVRPE